MEITRRSPFSGIVHTRTVNCTEAEYLTWVYGKPIQEAMPNVSPEDREFIMTGISPEEWEESFNG